MVSGTTTAGNDKAKQTGIIKRIIKRIDDWLTQRVRKPIDKWLTEEARKISDETPLSDPTKAFGELKEDKYKAELQLVDRYQSFVAELLRLSLLGIAAVLVKLSVHHNLGRIGGIFRRGPLRQTTPRIPCLEPSGTVMFSLSFA